ncbi:unnamed protein product [Bursaphelenchus xylophilus]|uniref:(pine wood nematode) hypothetical protein n=1 Tax=Bursaphelenchus xylophilus TaxID=6326 RepID=A0A1I7S4F4_BURXY|nr:unnamed protein product [Bursaphelenchus xylophilus]CAG9117037.1 unnamed protein product [Bursaphelenchus xylophilus]
MVSLVCAGLGIQNLQTEITDEMIDYYTNRPIHCNCTQRYSDLTYGFSYIPCISGVCTMPPNGSCETLQIYGTGYGARCSHQKIDGDSCEIVITTIGVANKCSCDDEDYCNSKFATTKPNVTEADYVEDSETVAPPISDEDLASSFFSDGDGEAGEKDMFHEDVIKMYMDKEKVWKEIQDEKDGVAKWDAVVTIVTGLVGVMIVACLVGLVGYTCYRSCGEKKRRERGNDQREAVRMEEMRLKECKERNRRPNKDAQINSTASEIHGSASNTTSDEIHTALINNDKNKTCTKKERVTITIEPSPSIEKNQSVAVPSDPSHLPSSLQPPSSPSSITKNCSQRQFGIPWVPQKPSKPDKKVCYNTSSKDAKIEG